MNIVKRIPAKDTALSSNLESIVTRTPDAANQAAIRALIAYYLAALSMIALLVIVGQVALELRLQEQSTSAHTVNVASRQRMLGEQIGKAVLAIQLMDSREGQRLWAQELAAAVHSLEAAHQGLQRGSDELKLKGRNSAEVKQLFARAEPDYQDLVRTAQEVYAVVHQARPEEQTPADVMPLVQRVLHAESTFARGMEAIVQQYNREAAAQADLHYRVELGILGITFLVLILQGAIVFRPAVNKLQQLLGSLVSVNILQENEEQYRALIEQLADGILIVEAETRRVIDANPALQRLLGYTLAELCTLTIYDLVAHDKASVDVNVARIIHEGMCHFGSRYYRRKDGTLVEVEVNASRINHAGVQAWCAIVLDTSARKQAEVALRNSEATNRALLNAIPDVMFQISRDGYYLNCNIPRDSNLMLTPCMVIGKHLAEVLPPDIAQQALHANEQAFQTGKMQIIEYQHHIDGAVIDYEARIVVISEDAALVIVRDITERKKIERMKNEFVSTVSHELRTPLTSIRGSLGLVMGGVTGELPDQARKMIDIAHKNSERLVRLINDMLDIEKIESGKMVFDVKPIRLMPLIEQALEANRAFAQQFGVILVLQASVSDVIVQGDADRLLQVMTNLLSNAAKFSPRDERVTISVQRYGPVVRVSVTDHGPGISPEFCNRIFQKFAQADSSDTRQVAGTGLGLSISKAIIEQHGGTIDFATEPGEGSTFFFELPVWHAPPEMQQIQNDSASQARVLICENDRNEAVFLHAALAQALDGARFVIDVANNATEAKMCLAHYDYAAMIVDACLPDQDGISLIQEVRTHDHTRHLPIVMVSSALQHREAPNERPIGIVDWLDWPIERERLVTAVQKALMQRPGYWARLLHVEDDGDVVQFIATMLRDVVEVVQAMTLQEAKNRLAHETFDLIIIDIALGDGSGLELLGWLNNQAGVPIPIIVFSAQELDRHHTYHVAAAFVKSRTSNETLFKTISSLIMTSVSPFLEVSARPAGAEGGTL